MLLGNENSNLVEILKELEKEGALSRLILIGGWCLYFYKIYFDNPGVPVLRTMDIDFLIPRPILNRKEINIPKILQNMGFEEKHNFLGKYNHSARTRSICVSKSAAN